MKETPLTKISNSSFREVVIPLQLKRAKFVPIPTSNPLKWNLLRPVSLTDHFAMVVKVFLIPWLMDDIDGEKDVNQRGNLKGLSTLRYLAKSSCTLKDHLAFPGL